MYQSTEDGRAAFRAYPHLPCGLRDCDLRDLTPLEDQTSGVVLYQGD